MTFKRYSLFEKRTLAGRLFKRHHTHFNDTYWAHRTALKFSYAATVPFNRADPTSVLFPLSQGDRRVPSTLGRWADSYSDFDMWVHMASVIALCGYLETYIAQVATAALESDPSLILGGGPKIDGAVYLKHNPQYDMYPHVEGLVRGDWQARSSHFSKLFGSCPYSTLIGDLERLRKLRNDAGHSFGRDIKRMKFAANWKIESLPKIKEKDLQHHLSVAEVVANEIEKQLAPVVGQYEIIKTLHAWLPHCDNPRLSVKEIGKQFSLHINELTGSPYGKQPSVSLIKYYLAL